MAILLDGEVGGAAGARPSSSSKKLSCLVDAEANVDFPDGSFSLEFTDPVTTTTYESSYTNSSSVTADGSVGLGAEGPNVTVGGSVTTDHSNTYDVPPTTILNQSIIVDAQPRWTFTPQSLALNADFEVNPTWTTPGRLSERRYR